MLVSSAVTVDAIGMIAADGARLKVPSLAVMVPVMVRVDRRW